jgi:hypothetical protein
MKKGDLFITKDGKTVFEIVGRWCGDMVLADTNEDSDHVLIYGASEIEELLGERYFKKLHKTGIKVKGE